MDIKQLEKEAEKEFPLPDKNYYVEGEAFIFGKAIALAKRKIFVEGGLYVLENLKLKDDDTTKT